KIRPTLNNIYENILHMLGISNALNTCQSKNFKDIAMSNQQGFEIMSSAINFIVFLNLNVFIMKCRGLLEILRDYKRMIVHLEWLRDSPKFCIRINFGSCHASQGQKLINVSLNKLLKRGFSLDIARAPNNNKPYNTNGIKLDPMWVTGFVDAEGCFSIIIEITDSLKWKVRTSFEINLHEKDAEILYEIQSFFGVGGIYNRSDRKISVYRVTNVNNLNDVIIPHFRKYPLISKKGLDFVLWSSVIKIILNKDHLTKAGFLTILSYYASINRGVSKKVLKYYPNILPFPKAIINLPDNLNPQWVSGFVAGDGGFSVYIRPAKDYLLLEKVDCRFHIAQHSKDIELMKLFVKFFDCGLVNLRSNLSTPRCDFIVQDVTSLLNKIIPHFYLYPLLNLKQEDYNCFKEAMLMVKLKKHLTKEGLIKIKSLNLEMNSNRLK
uniref:hypothetical protein n=1 Tax=Ciborinia camelliae TaxID=647257 RepID=UPI001FA6F97F